MFFHILDWNLIRFFIELGSWVILNLKAYLISVIPQTLEGIEGNRKPMYLFAFWIFHHLGFSNQDVLHQCNGLWRWLNPKFILWSMWIVTYDYCGRNSINIFVWIICANTKLGGSISNDLTIENYLVRLNDWQLSIHQVSRFFSNTSL